MTRGKQSSASIRTMRMSCYIYDCFFGDYHDPKAINFMKGKKDRINYPLCF